MEADKKAPIKGIRIQTLNLIMIFASCILYIMLISATIHALQKYELMLAATDDYIDCEQNAVLAESASHYLTEQVQLYTITMDMEYVANYFEEVYVTRRRDTVFQALESYDIRDTTYNYLSNALKNSNLLMEKEIYAMKLIATANHHDVTAFPDLASTALAKEDELLNSEEMIEKAHQLVFGPEYQESMDAILDDISSCINDIINETYLRQQESTSRLKRTMSIQHLLITILFIENILFFIFIIRMIIKPLKIYIDNIKEEKRLEVTGAYEFKYLAQTYNNIFEQNAANELMLRHQAEHDPLTGIINRGAFDQLKEALSTKSEPLALLIIDVDKFKLINDNYGHEIGDKVLQKVAALLEKSFRSTDFPARIGGDEFAVIVTNVTPKLSYMIQNKIDSINESLLNPSDDLPKVSLSAGCAFSGHGFADELYPQADAALYEVKNHGRCGCRFYQS